MKPRPQTLIFNPELTLNPSKNPNPDVGVFGEVLPSGDHAALRGRLAGRYPARALGCLTWLLGCLYSLKMLLRIESSWSRWWLWLWDVLFVSLTTHSCGFRSYGALHVLRGSGPAAQALHMWSLGLEDTQLSFEALEYRLWTPSFEDAMQCSTVAYSFVFRLHLALGASVGSFTPPRLWMYYAPWQRERPLAVSLAAPMFCIAWCA